MKDISELVFVDVEADGPYVGDYSMVCLGACLRSKDGEIKTFYGGTKPISEIWDARALSVSGISREKHLTFPEPKETMLDFKDWLNDYIPTGRKVFISDNLAFDWQWVNYYFHRFTGDNPFGFSGRRIGDFYSGIHKTLRKTTDWKRFRKTPHDHNPVNDAVGNLEAFETILKNYNIR